MNMIFLICLHAEYVDYLHFRFQILLLKQLGVGSNAIILYHMRLCWLKKIPFGETVSECCIFCSMLLQLPFRSTGIYD